MRRLKVNHEQFVVIFMAAFIVTVGGGYFIYIGSIDEETEFRWYINSDTQGIYWIVIESAEPIHSSRVEFRIEEADGTVADVMDPSGRSIALEGRLSDIEFNRSDQEEARESGWPGAVFEPEFSDFNLFYTGVPNGKTNLTLFIVFDSANEKLAPGFILIRSVTSGGVVQEDYQLRLSVPDRDEQIAKTSFPHAITPLNLNVRENANDYRMGIINSEPWPLTDIEFSVLNHNRLVATYDGLDGNEYRMEGNISDIVYDPRKMQGNVYRDIFYTSSRHQPNNITWYLVYMDSDLDGHISSGDNIWIRDKKNGGAVDEDFRLRLVNTEIEMSIVETTMIIPTFELIWNISIINGTYCIDIINTTRYHLDSIIFNLTTPDGINATAMSPDGQNTTLFGSLQDINFTEWQFDQANGSEDPNATFQDKFYSYDDDKYYWSDNRWWVNQTLFIIIEDLDSNGRLSNRDKIWLRSLDQGGAADSDYVLRLSDDHSNREYPVITL